MICILVSLKKEISLFLSLLKNVKKERAFHFTVYSGDIGKNSVRIIKTGIGNKRFQKELFKDCSLVISTGFCGALDPELKSGDTIVSNEVLTVDKEKLSNLLKYKKYKKYKNTSLNQDTFEKITINEDLIKDFSEILKKYEVTMFMGATFTSSKVIKNYSEKISLYNTFNAISVDMEDYSRFEFLKSIGITFVSIRAVLDDVHDDIPAFESGFKMPSQVFMLFSKLAIARESIAFFLEKIISNMK